MQMRKNCNCIMVVLYLEEGRKAGGKDGGREEGTREGGWRGELASPEMQYCNYLLNSEN